MSLGRVGVLGAALVLTPTNAVSQPATAGETREPARPAAPPRASVQGAARATGAAGHSSAAPSGRPVRLAPLAGPRKAMGSALSRVADRIGGELREQAAGVPAFVGPLRSDEAAPRAAELSLRLGALLAGAMGVAASAQAEPVTLATAHALARKARGFVYIQPEIAHGEVRVSADLFLVVRNVWDRVRQLAPAPVAHSFASERVDAEVRGYLVPVPPLTGSVQRVHMDERDVLALECADADHDGAFEIVTVGRHRTVVGRLRDGKYVPLHVAVLRDLVEIAPVPLREPLASVVFVASEDGQSGYLDVGITDRAHGLRFDASLVPVGRIPGVPIHTAGPEQCARFEGTVFNASLVPCAPDERSPRSSTGAVPSSGASGSAILPSGSGGRSSGAAATLPSGAGGSGAPPSASVPSGGAGASGAVPAVPVPAVPVPAVPVPAVPVSSAFDAMYEAAIVARDGVVHRVRAMHNPFTNELELEADDGAVRGSITGGAGAGGAGGANVGVSGEAATAAAVARGGAARAAIAHAGAQVAVADLDADGVADIVSTLDALPAPAPGSSALRVDTRGGEPDALVVSSWSVGSTPQERIRVPVPAGVRAVATCPPDGPSASAVLLATAGELWIVR